MRSAPFEHTIGRGKGDARLDQNERHAVFFAHRDGNVCDVRGRRRSANENRGVVRESLDQFGELRRSHRAYSSRTHLGRATGATPLIALRVLLTAIALLFWSSPASATQILRGGIYLAGQNQSPDGTMITGTGQQIIDSSGNIWTLVNDPVQALQVYKNGALFDFSSHAAGALWYGGTIYHWNANLSWYSAGASTWSAADGDPRPAAPAIDSPLTATAVVGTPFSYTITASHNPNDFSASGLPSWATLTGAVIAGTPDVTTGSPFSITIGASNAAGSDSDTLVLTVNSSGGGGTGEFTSSSYMVFAHEMAAVPRAGGGTTVTDCRNVIKGWKDLGLDAALIFDDNPGGTLRNVIQMYHQAAILENFHVAVTCTYVSSSDRADHVSFLSGLAGGSYADGRLLVDGKVFISCYHASSDYPNMIADLNTAGVTTYAEPMAFPRTFSGDPNSQSWDAGSFFTSPSTIGVFVNHPTWSDMDGFALWDSQASITDGVADTNAMATATAAAGKTGRVNVLTYYAGMPMTGNGDVNESNGYQRIRDDFLAAITSGAKHVEILTSNDRNEKHYFIAWQNGTSESDPEPPMMRSHWDDAQHQPLLSHRGWREYMKRYVRWFHERVEPPITQLELFYAYRLHARDCDSWAALDSTRKTAMDAWVPVSQQGSTHNALKAALYRKDGLGGTGFSWNGNDSNGLNWPRLTDAIWIAVRIDAAHAPADVFINGTKVGDDLGVGEYLLQKNGSDSTTGQQDLGYGTTRHTFNSADISANSGGPLFEVKSSDDSTTYLSGRGRLPIFDFPIGNWNVYADKLANGDTCITSPP